MLSIYKKEISIFLSSLIGLIAIALFLVASSLFFWIFPDSNVFSRNEASLNYFFQLAPGILLFLIPAITMRLFSEEKKSGTLDLLLTKPISEIKIVLGKFFAAWTLLIISLLPTLIYWFSISQLGSEVGSIDTGATIGSYFGLVFMAGCFVAIGLFCSAITSNQIVAFIFGIFLCFFFYSAFGSLSRLTSLTGRFDLLLQQVGIEYHYASISRGVFDLRDFIYFLSFIALFIYLTKMALESRKWDKRSLRSKSFSRMLAIVGILVIVNFLAGNFVKRFDLTDDKRYSLTDGTKRMLSGLEKEFYFKVYLEGDLPAELKKYRNSIKYMLEEFRIYSNNQIHYDFIDPAKNRGQEEVASFYSELEEAGLLLRTYGRMGFEEVKAKTVVPGAMIYMDEEEIPLLFCHKRLGELSDAEIYQNEPLLEYKIAKAVRSLSQQRNKPKISFLTGHSELPDREIVSAARELIPFYDMSRLNLRERQWIPQEIEAVVIAQPLLPYGEQEKLKIDQYIMRGGSVLWAIDPLHINWDSLTQVGSYSSLPLQLELDDLLFKYGARVNPDLVQDRNCAQIPLVVGYIDGQPQTESYPWYFYPKIQHFSSHPISNGLDFMQLKFASTVDSVGAKGIRKTPLIFSSNLSRTVFPPVDIQFRNVKQELRPEQFNNPDKAMAMLLEGAFTSVFQHRPGAVESLLTDTLRQAGYQAQGERGKMIVVGDAEWLKTDFAYGRPTPMGLDPRTGAFSQNADFLLNCMEYLTDNSGLMESRSKEFKARLLDPLKVKTEATKWKMINMLLPLLLIGLLALAFSLIRIRRYAY